MINQDIRKTTVAVAMSGGIDSAMTACLLKEQGRSLIAVTAIMTPEGSRCCSEEDLVRARDLAKQLDIPHHTIDVSAEFKREVIDYFSSEYLSGRTPSPCLLCNQIIKFGILHDQAMELGAGVLATGHYARITQDDGSIQLQRGRDANKDQSYFLSRLSSEQLASSLFPLGDMTKTEVIARAEELDISARNSRESQELCFVTQGTHGEWIDLHCLNRPHHGEILDAEGTHLGEHNGIHHYTIGQRRGLGIAMGEPTYVTQIDANKNTLTLGPRESAMRRDMELTELNWISGKPTDNTFTASVQIRYNHTAAPATISLSEDQTASVQFDDPQFAVTPGQAAVFYNDTQTIGGGWIK